MSVSACFAVLALLLVFALPKRVEAPGAPTPKQTSAS